MVSWEADICSFGGITTFKVSLLRQNRRFCLARTFPSFEAQPKRASSEEYHCSIALASRLEAFCSSTTPEVVLYVEFSEICLESGHLRISLSSFLSDS